MPVEQLVEMVEVGASDFIALHLGTDPTPEFVDMARKAVEEAWGPEARVLFIQGGVRMTVIRDYEVVG